MELEKRGYVVRRVFGYAAVDQAWNEFAAKALADGFEETLWIDSDIPFDPAAVERLRSHGLLLEMAAPSSPALKQQCNDWGHSASDDQLLRMKLSIALSE